MDRPLPLTGIRVLDCSRVLAGPFATMLLADLGAEIWKVEPPDGDETRRWGPPFWGDPAQGMSAYFASVNRGKRALVVDLRSREGLAVFDRLAAMSDLLVHNLRPGSAERLGLGAARLSERHPRLVVAAVGGFAGADADRPAYDLLAQAVSGLMAVTGDPDGPPTKVGVALVDLLAGLEAAVGGLAALLDRDRIPARRVDVGLVEAGVTGLVNLLGAHLATGEEPRRHGNAHPHIVPYEVFAARDGQLALAVGNDTQFAALLDVLGLEDADARFASNPRRVERRSELVDRLAASIAAWGRSDLLAALAAADVPAGPVNTVAEALAAVRAASPAGWDVEIEGVRLAPSPIRIDGELTAPGTAPPRLGEHTDVVLAEAGFGADEIAQLRSAGIVA
jgi:crotonobetainyl-CoA:carnitine CoA-transferase CaiB-like acyl-CoA transferase